MKLTALFATLLITISASAQEVIRLYDGPAPGTEEWNHEEKEYFSPIFGNQVVTNVVNPTLTVFRPDEGKANGAALIIAPGGGFHALSIDSEGNDVARRLNEEGVTCFVLRYRLVPTGEDGVKEMMMKIGKPDEIQAAMMEVAPHSGADGLRAVEYVRENAKQFGIDPTRIGFIGFSAGGNVTVQVALLGKSESRADFVAPIYAAQGGLEDIPTPKNAPPAFILAASDDQLGLAQDSIDIYQRWLDAKRPVELHMYARGGHGFGMKEQGLPSDAWAARFIEWLQQQGFLAE